jgi:hypothetical protein
MRPSREGGTLVSLREHQVSWDWRWQGGASAGAAGDCDGREYAGATQAVHNPGYSADRFQGVELEEPT